MFKVILTACVFIGMSVSSAVAQTTRVVDDDGMGTSANCDDPTPAFSTVAAAITASADGDTVLVCPGLYIGSINFGGKAIAVRSTAGAGETIIDGDAAGAVVMFFSRETSASILEGFTIRNGNYVFGGGGIVIELASPVIRHNVITDNAACDSLGISVQSGAPLIEDNIIANNVQFRCGINGTWGGGISIHGFSPAIVRRNHIYGNATGWLGGGIVVADASPTIEFNVISGNSAMQGGGIGIVGDASPTIRGNLIIGNEAQSGGGIYWLTRTTTPGIVLVNNTIADNDAITGSAVLAGGRDQGGTLWNNILVAAAGQTAVLCGNPGDAIALYAPAFYSNDVFSATAASYSGLCTDQTGLNGNISADPLFVEPATNDYHLLSGSPAIDAGNEAATALPGTDLDGHTRILDGDGDALAVIDIGADEAPTAATAPGSFGRSSPVDMIFDQPQVISLTWEASAGATAYEYCYDTVNNNACDGSWNPAGSGTSATLFDLDTLTTYYWQVRARNDAGVTYANGDSSSYSSFATGPLVLTRIISLVLTPPSSSFVAGRSVGTYLYIRNTGNDVLTVSGITYSAGLSGVSWSGTLAHNEAHAVPVLFSPVTAGTYSGTVTVDANQTYGTNSIAFVATVIPAVRVVTVTGDLSFGSVQAGMTATRTLTISNQGNDALNVSSISYPSGFSGSWSGTIFPGASQTVTVTFAPTLSTTYGGTIALSANDTSGSNVITATGVGTLPPGTQILFQNIADGSLDAWYVKGSNIGAKLPFGSSRVTDLNWRVAGTGDLNGDGHIDVVWQHAREGWVGVWFMNGNAVISTTLFSIPAISDVNWRIRGVADVNGDGRADLIWQHGTEGWVGVWLMNGNQVLSTSFLSINRVADTDWEIVGAGDTNGDGKADIIWQHRTAGWLGVWTLNATQVLSTQLLTISQVTDSAWHIRGVGDCTGDGRADLLWQNDASGALGIWELNGAMVTSWQLLSSSRSDTNWRMVGPG